MIHRCITVPAPGAACTKAGEDFWQKSCDGFNFHLLHQSEDGVSITPTRSKYLCGCRIKAITSDFGGACAKAGE